MDQFEAARIGDLEWFNNNKFDINAQDKYGNTVLILASLRGHKEIAFKLIDSGANLDLQDNLGSSALMGASWNDHKEIAFALIEKGAKLDLQNDKKYTALICASWYGRKEIAFALIEKGANLDLQDDTKDIIAEGKPSCSKVTALTVASLWGRKEIVDAIESWQCTPRSLKYTIQMHLKGCDSDTSNVPNLLLQRNTIEKEINKHGPI